MARSPQWLIYLSFSLLGIFSFLTYQYSNNWRLVYLSFVSGTIGFLFKYGNIGFTGAFRRFVTNFDMFSFRQGLAFFFFGVIFCQLVPKIKGLHPIIYPTRTSFGNYTSPIGWSLIIGSFIFGSGMQLGSGCASGTFVGLGEGALKSYVVLPFFIFGSTWSATDSILNWYSNLSYIKPINISLFLMLFIIILLFILSFIPDFIRVQKAAKGLNSLTVEEAEIIQKNVQSPWYKPYIYPFLLGLATGIFYMFFGNPLGVAGVFPKIGGLIYQKLGGNPNSWKFFKGMGGVPKTLFNEPIVISNIFLGIGAFIASSIMGNFGIGHPTSMIELIKSVFGGFIMGIGARMSYGCNIGSMYSGITSLSLHGLIWMFCAILGSALTVQVTKYITYKNSEQAKYSVIL